jgi:putative DNA primase/helicase
MSNGKPRGRKPTSNGKPRRYAQTPEAALAAIIREHGEPTASWVYHYPDGSEALRVYRFDLTNPETGKPEKTYRPVHPEPEGWVLGDPRGPLPLYRLPGLTGAVRAYVTEGEKCAELLRRLGLTATTSAHGAQSAHKTDWSPLASLEVVVLPDHNSVGEDYAKAVLRLLARLQPRPRVRVLRLDDLWQSAAPIPEGSDIEQWLSSGVPEGWTPEDCRAALDRIADAAPLVNLDSQPAPESLGEIPPSWDWPEEPQPVRFELRPVTTLEPEMIPAPLRGWLNDIAERVSCPLDFPAVGAIVSAGIVVGRKIAIRPKCQDDWTVVPNLWGAIVGRPGVLKTPALKEATAPLRRLEARARERHAEARRDFEAEALVASTEAETAKKALKDAAREGKSKDVLNDLARKATQAEAPSEPILARYTTSDTTVEKLGELLRDNPNGIGVIRDELAGWMRGLDKEGRECDRTFYLEAWDGDGTIFTYDRIGRGTILIHNPCVSILGGIQPGPLRLWLRRAARGEGDDDGLMQRFQLIVWPNTSAGWNNVDRWPATNEKNRAYAIFAALDTLDPSALGATASDDGGPPYLRFASEAQALFDSWRTELEAKLRLPDQHPMIESHLARFRSLMPSLALLFHLIDVANGAPPGPVGIRAARLAVAWCRYLEARDGSTPVLGIPISNRPEHWPKRLNPVN